MIHLSNADVARVLDMPAAVGALRAGYADLERGDAAYIPRIDIYGPTGAEAGQAYRWGSMAGICRTYGVLAVRMKSDVVFWPDGRTEEKFCVRPGLYSGFILLFSQRNGEPLALIQDGYLQHMRVGAAAGLGTERMARPDSSVLGILGSGGMAERYFDAISALLPIREVRVYSPTQEHREAFASRLQQRSGVAAQAFDDPEAVVRGSDVVASATDAMQPTFAARWVAPGTHVVNVGAQEIGPDVLERADVVRQLGFSTIPAFCEVPGVEYGVGAIASYYTGSPQERAAMPRSANTSQHRYPLLFAEGGAGAAGRTDPSQVTLLLNAGTQGLQFAAVAGWVYREAAKRRLGTPMPQEWFLENVRD